MEPRYRYDPTVDALYVYLVDFAPGAIAWTDVVDDTRYLDTDGHGGILGIEILDASKGVTLDGLPRPELVCAVLGRLAAQWGWRTPVR